MLKEIKTENKKNFTIQSTWAMNTKDEMNMVLAEWWGTENGLESPLTSTCSVYLTIMNPLDLTLAKTAG